MPDAIVELWFDGGCEPTNPGGHMTAAYVMRSAAIAGGGCTGAVCIPRAPANTNNVAEWKALENGVDAYLAEPACSGLLLVIRGDSKLVINQLNNSWACNKSHLAESRCRVWQKLKGIDWRAEWVPREQNTEADEAGRVAYQGYTGQPMPDRSKMKRTA